MTKVAELHKRWMGDIKYREAYDALEEEFARAADIAVSPVNGSPSNVSYDPMKVRRPRS